LYKLYAKLEHCFYSFLKLLKALKKSRLNPNNVELGVVKIKELQGQYQTLQFKVRGLQNEMQVIQYKIWNLQRLKQELERDRQAIQEQKMELTDILNTLAEF
jgi:chromosome segregation ATPase